MEKFEVIIEYKDGRKLKLNNVKQINKYDISDNVGIEMTIPATDIKSYYVNFFKKKETKNDTRRIKNN